MRTHVAALILVLSLASRGDTFLEQETKKMNRLVPLTKITVGPDDQYQAAVDSANTIAIYTKKTDLVPRLYRMTLADGQETEFLPASADSQQAAVSPSGLVAFVYYKFSARGDICYRSITGPATEPVKCLKTEDGEKSSPFWKNGDELGYVVRDIGRPTAKVVVQDLKVGEKTTALMLGRLWSPAMKPGGKSLFFIEMTSEAANVPANRRLRMKDLRTGDVKTLNFPLPGISGFPAVNEDETYLYFSHYLSDTNGDGNIDGDDNSVVFRAPIASFADGKPVFPEQLTSAENNCSFPRPVGNQVYLTCAYEGSLDIYRMPATGVVPPTWDMAALQNAHQTARTYDERILLLNTMRYRGAPHSAERLLSNHLMADDTTAARFYLQEVRAAAPPKEKTFYGLFDHFLDARELRKAQRTAEVTPAYERDELAVDARLAAASGPERLKSIFRGTIRGYLGQTKEAQKHLAKIDMRGKAHPLELHYWYELAVLAADAKKLDEVYKRMLTAKELSEESRIYYAFRYLAQIEKAEAERVARLDKMIASTEGAVNLLLKSELVTLKIIQAKDAPGKDKAYAELDQLISQSASNFFLRKALYVRSILNLAEAAEFNYMTYVAANWIRYTTAADTEYANARDVFINASLDRAYVAYGDKKFQTADNYFYGSLTITDDLESHLGYLRSMIARGERKTIDERYQNLVDRKMIGDNFKFVQAALKIADSQEIGAYQEAEELLSEMTQDRDSPMRYLLLGSVQLERFLRRADAYKIDLPLFDKTHRNLSLAYDLGRDNQRIKAAALQNLAMLHQRVQNHGLAARFLQRRRDLGFTSGEEKAANAWLLARSLFYTYQPERAAEELSRVLDDKTLKLPPEFLVPLRERRAFYLADAGKHELAAKEYDELLAAGAITGEMNLAKVYLAQGYSHFKNKKGKSAREAFQKAAEQAEKLSKIPAGGDRLIAFEPARLLLVAYGFLGQLGERADREVALDKRKNLLLSRRDLLLEWRSAYIQNRLQAAVLAEKHDAKLAASQIREALDVALTLGKDDQFIARAVYETGVAYLAHALAHPELYKNSDTEQIQNLVNGATAAYDQMKPLPPEAKSRRAKLKSMWATYNLVSRS